MTPQDEQNAWQDYVKVLNSGMFWELHPDLSGKWANDRIEFIEFWKEKQKCKPTPPPTKMIREGVKPTTTPITPAHYGGAKNTYEAIKVIEAWGLNFSLGNVVKYISRAGKKENTTALQDLLKAKTYIEFEIAKHEALHR